MIGSVCGSPSPTLPSCSSTPLISCPATVNRFCDRNSCSAIVSFNNPVGTSPCDGVASASLMAQLPIPDTTIVSSAITINSFRSGSILGGQVSLQSVCMNISHAFVGQLNAALVSPGGDTVLLFSDPGAGINGCNGDSLSVCFVLGNGFSLDDTSLCNSYPAYTGSYTTSAGDLDAINNGSSANGTWELLVYDDEVGVLGTLVQWSLNFVTNTVTTQTAGPASGSVFAVGTTNIGFTAIDGFGNTGSCSFNVVVSDSLKPTIECNKDTLTSTPGVCGKTGHVISLPTTRDNCSVLSITNNAPSLLPVGNTLVTWTVVDIYGNSSICMDTITVIDIEDPSITCPGNISVNALAGVCSVSSISLGLAIANDNCGIDSIINNGYVAYSVGVTPITWTATARNGVKASCIQTVTVVDNQNPTIICGGLVGLATEQGGCTVPSSVLNVPSVSDNCGIASIVNNAPASLSVGTTTVSWTVTDVNGLTASCLQTVIVTDEQNPVIICPGNISVNVDAGQCNALNVNLGTANAYDNCGVQSIINNAPTAFNTGVTNVTWTVNDAHGNSATCVQMVTVFDNENPTLTCPDTLQVNNETGLCYASNLNLGTPSALDNCVIQSITNNAQAIFLVGTSDVIWTVADVNGNTSTCSQTVIVIDNQVPNVSCPTDVSFILAASSCDANIILTNPIAADNCGIATVTNNAPAFFPTDTSTVVWTVTDVHGNSNNCNQIVTVTDNTLPVIICAGNVSVNVDAGQCSASNVNLGATNATDNCTIANLTSNAPVTFSVGVTNVTWTATDVNGNSNSCVQEVNVVDNIGLQMVCPDTVVQQVDAGQCGSSAISLGLATTSGNCSVLAIINNSPTIFNAGITNVIWTATDVNGNFSTCNQIVMVVDNESPTITCPSNDTVNNDAGTCHSTISLTAPSASDNCSIASFINDAATPFQIGHTTVTWTVTDASGNTASCSQVITVNDSQLPNISCSAQSINANAGVCGLLNASLILPFVSDNCSIANLANNALDTLPVGIQNILWTVTDVNGNSSTCAQLVTIVDNESPTIICATGVSTNPDAGSCAASNVNLGTPVTNDNCGITSVTNNAASAFGIGTSTVTWLVIDVNGNSTSCTQLVTVTDNILPSISCPNDVGVNVDGGSCSASNVSLGNPNTSDNCGISSLTNDEPTIFQLGNTLVTWSVTDVSGNMNTCTQNVLVIGGIDTTISISGNTYTANAIGAAYQWYDCNANSNIADSTAQSFSPSVSGSYALIVSSGGCLDTTACFSVTIVGLDNLPVNASLKVFPNPASEEVFLQVTGKIEGFAKLQILDADGRLLREFSYENMGGNYPISLNNLAPSIYQLRVSTKQNVWNAKVMKVN